MEIPDRDRIRPIASVASALPSGQCLPMRLPSPLPLELRDDDLILRAATLQDLGLEQELSRVDDIVRWTSMPAYLSEDQARQRIARACHQRAQGVLARFVVERAGCSVGIAGARAGPDGSVEVSYALLASSRGVGNASRAARGLAVWADGAGATAVTLMTFPGNTASQHTAVRAGFRREGLHHALVKGVEVELLRFRWNG